ncbi:MAG TPA: Npt1/Npt2 family nucleotide transporter, partial [Vicinamibacterales bacterium]|nr:Npt1/Npt2 family nucleotide transporter [Vicinamibacterales bacterium]
MTPKSATIASALTCAGVTAQLVGGKATRDALFLMSLGVGALPLMLMTTAAVSVLLVYAHSWVAQRVAPRTLVPVLFALSGGLYLGEWVTAPMTPSITAVLVYLHVSIAVPLLASGFWLIASEAFNPRSARAGFGGIAGAGTLGGLAGALVTERVAVLSSVTSMLVILGVMQILTAWLIRALAAGTLAPAVPEPIQARGEPAPRSSLRVIAQAPHLRVVAILVVLGTLSAAILDYVFKARAVESFGFSDGLLRFFALYYAAISGISFVLQTVASRPILERFGLGLTASAPSIALLAGSIGSLIAPGLGSLIVARGGEAVFRASWFRAGYEIFYTPIAPQEKRSAKALIDVGLERFGDAAGAGLVRLITSLASTPVPWLLGVSMLTSVAAVIAASHLNRWYVRMLESSLVRRGGNVDLSRPEDEATARVVARVRGTRHGDTSVTAAATTAGGPLSPPSDGPDIRDIRALQSGDLNRARGVLSRDEGLSAGLVAHVIPLLGVDELADHAVFALRKVAEERVGELTDALIDSNLDLVVRRRLAQVLSACVSQRAADCLLLALDDARFDVRTQVGRSLAAILDRNRRIRFDRERMYDAVLREIDLGRPVWESRRLLDASADRSPLDAFVRERARQSLAHVFTLLSLVLPREPLQIAFRSLQRDDRHLRGTALEYLESTLPSAVRQQLLPYL